jgi:hypothetical protein
MDRPKRKNIPLRVKLEACLILLGFDPDEVRKRLPDFDHFPALGLRPVNPAGADYDPPQHDPSYLRPMKHDDHKLKTNGRRGESDLSLDSNSDKARIAKSKRLDQKRAADAARRDAEERGAQRVMQERIAATNDLVRQHVKQRVAQIPSRGFAKGPKRSIPSRPFPKRKDT